MNAAVNIKHKTLNCACMYANKLHNKLYFDLRKKNKIHHHGSD